MKTTIHLVVASLGLSLGQAALGQGMTGTWSSEATHSQAGALRGEVVVRRTAHGYELEATYPLGDGRAWRWTGRGDAYGRVLVVEVRYDTVGLTGRITDPTRARDKGIGNYRLSPDGATLRGSWETSVAGVPRVRLAEALTRHLDSGQSDEADLDPAQVIEVDLDVLRADGKVVPDDEEETEGMVVPVNVDDDDGDGGQGGDGEVDLVPDKDDPDSIRGEDDLIELRVRAAADAPPGACFRLRFGRRVAVWSGQDRTERLRSRRTLLPATEPITLRVEGLAASDPGQGERIVLELVDRRGRVLGSDAVTVHVTRSAFLIYGDPANDHYLRRRVGRRAYDRRRQPTIVKGRSADGRDAYWAIYSGGDEKFAKLALATEGAVVAYKGHSNFGMGFAFDTNLSSLSEFMNIADPQVPVNWEYLRDHQGHPDLMFDEAEFGDDRATRARFDPVRLDHVVRGTLDSYGSARFPLRIGAGSGGERLRLRRGRQPWSAHHSGRGENKRIVVQAGSRDMPAKRWSALFLHSCYSGQYYSESFGGRGVLFFTNDSVYDSAASALFILGFVDGKSNDSILEDLNEVDDAHDYIAFD